LAEVLLVWQSGYPWDVRVEKFAAALTGAGHAVTILARARPGEAATALEGGVRIERVGGAGPRALSTPVSWNPLWRRAIARAVDRLRPALVIVRDIPLAEAAGAACRARGIPLVLDMAEHYPAAMRGWKKYNENPLLRLAVHGLKLPDRVEKKAVALSDGIVVVCREQGERLHRRYGVPPARVAVAHNSPAPGAFQGVRAGARNPPRVLSHHGHITRARGLDVLIKAFQLVSAEFPELVLSLPGAGENLDELKAQVGALGLGGRVLLPGPYPYDALPKILDDLDVGVVPYPSSEFMDTTIANKIFDYLAAGKPFLVSESAPMRRLVEETGAGLWASAQSPEAFALGLRNILRADLGAMSKRGLEAARTTYNWDVDSARLLRFLKTVASL
jgi:glycosyltransferase involved in cell wall biosynthesis